MAILERTIIQQGATIGANATILHGDVIGEHAMIGAGSVVTKDIPAGELWKSNIAVFYKYLNNNKIKKVEGKSILLSSESTKRIA